jgi:threonyl-tRNA synthetase
LPERFQLEYASADGKREQPIMLHRAIFGSLERFFGVLIESTAGDFPFWLAPVQLRLLPVSDDFRPFCERVLATALDAGVRAEIDAGGRSLSKQIKVANEEKVPILAVVGRKEVESSSLTLARRKGGDSGPMPIAEAIARLAEARDRAEEPLQNAAAAGGDQERTRTSRVT